MKRIIAILIIVTVLVIAVSYPFFSAVVAEEGESGRPLAFFLNKPGEKFSIKYIHSIHRTPVLETYLTNKNGEIVQTEIRFEEFGIGMPSGPSGNETFTQKNGTYILANMNRTFSSLDIRVGQVVADHRLIIDGEEYPFSSFSDKGSWVRIETKKWSMWQWMIGGKRLGKQ